MCQHQPMSDPIWRSKCQIQKETFGFRNLRVSDIIFNPFRSFQVFDVGSTLNSPALSARPPTAPEPTARQAPSFA